MLPSIKYSIKNIHLTEEYMVEEIWKYFDNKELLNDSDELIYFNLKILMIKSRNEKNKIESENYLSLLQSFEGNFGDD